MLCHLQILLQCIGLYVVFHETPGGFLYEGKLSPQRRLIKVDSAQRKNFYLIRHNSAVPRYLIGKAGGNGELTGPGGGMVRWKKGTKGEQGVC